MASQSFYRKWRSQTFADVVGQSHVTRTLRNALQMGRIGHAYLLCGPRGVGKTSVARILAKAVNCWQPRDGEPCNECAMCLAITEGRSLDVIEIDAASNRRIEEMRDLREKVNFAPNEARYKVYILDEAHMLTNEASNALLKTLEEPPAHTVFVLVTTEAHRIAETIISRCQRFNFRRISGRETIDRLSLVCEREGLTVDSDALAVVARAATGSLRDAEGLLDQLVAYCGKEIAAEQARDVLGLSGEEAIRQLAECVLDSNLPIGLELVNKVADAGADLGRFVEDFVSYLRGLLLLKGGAEASLLSDLSSDAVESMRRYAERVNLEQLVRLIRIFGETEQGTRGGTAPQLALELALAESILQMGREPRSAQPRVGAERGSRPAEPTERAPVRSAASGPEPERLVAPPKAKDMPSAPVEKVHRATGVSSDRPNNGQSEGQELPPLEPIRAPSVSDSEGTLLDILRQRWGEILEMLGTVNRPLQALLRSCGPYQAREDHIVVGCDAGFHRDKLGETQNRQMLEKAISELLGTRVLLRFEVVPRQKRGQPPSATSDPLVKEVLSWGGRIRQVVQEQRASDGADRTTEEPAEAGD